jgi:acid stress chaperone HdeB
LHAAVLAVALVARQGSDRRAGARYLNGCISMKLNMAIVAALVLFAAVPARAQQLDLSTVTCKQFIESDKDTIGLILMWMEGYYTEQNAKPIVDFDKMKKDGGKLGEYCSKNPGHGLITAADEILDK